MDLQDYMRFVLALALVLGLIGLLVWALRRSGFSASGAKGRRLGVSETMMVGPRHRLLLVRRDDVEHLLLLGPSQQTQIEAGIRRSAEPQSFSTILQSSERPL